jgi:hypothetical protein
MDGFYENKNINVKKEFITKENIVELFKKYNVPQHINLLSVDIDFNDFYCLKEILSNYTCDIIICEYNSSHLPNEDKIVIYYNKGWDCTNYFRASLLSLDKLCKKYNYSLIYCDKCGVNCFFIHNDIINQKKLQFKNFGNITKIYKKPGYGYDVIKKGHPQDNLYRHFITYEEALNNNYINIFIGTSTTNYKQFTLDKSFPESAVFVLNKHNFTDTFSITLKGNILFIQRTDILENIGWGHGHSGYIYYPLIHDKI